MFLDSGKCFGFWKVILSSGKCLGLWEGFVPTSHCNELIRDITSYLLQKKTKTKEMFNNSSGCIVSKKR